jgi:endonuclease III related protein
LVPAPFLTWKCAVAIVKFAMASAHPLPNFAPTKKRETKSVSRRLVQFAPEAQPILRDYYTTLLDAHGPQYWWSARSRFEVIVGAILVQNTAWTNVKTALRNLRREKLLTPQAIHAVPTQELSVLIRSSGYFRQKAKKLKAFAEFLYAEYGGSLAKMFRTPTAALREQLLTIHGIGPETADSILLYAGGHTVFVIDAYARRMLERHELASPGHSYDELRRLFEASLPKEAPLFNEFHALIVRTGKDFCWRSAPDCNGCALRKFLPATSPLLKST